MVLSGRWAGATATPPGHGTPPGATEEKGCCGVGRGRSGGGWACWDDEEDELKASGSFLSNSYLDLKSVTKKRERGGWKTDTSN